MTAILEPYFLKSPRYWHQSILGLLVIAGIYLLSLHNLTTGNLYLGIGIGLLSALTLALRNIIMKPLTRHYPSTALMFQQIAIGSLCLIPFCVPELIHATSKDWIYLLLSGLFCTAIAHPLFLKYPETITNPT